MNTVIKQFFVILAIFALSISAYGIEKEDILLYWSCDEGEGEEVKDVSENGRNAEWRDGVSKRSKGEWTEGKFGQALDFSVGNICVVYETEDDADLRKACGSVPFTVAYYVKTTMSVGKGRTVDFGSHGCSPGWHSAVNTGKIIFEAADGACIHHWDVAVNDGQWHHVAHSVIPGETVHTYIDGVQNMPDFDAMSAKKSVEPFEGREIDLGVSLRFNTEYLDAQMDEIVLFNYALSKEEVDEIMQAPMTEVLAVEPMDKVAATWGDIKIRY